MRNHMMKTINEAPKNEIEAMALVDRAFFERLQVSDEPDCEKGNLSLLVELRSDEVTLVFKELGFENPTRCPA